MLPHYLLKTRRLYWIMFWLTPLTEFRNRKRRPLRSSAHLLYKENYTNKIERSQICQNEIFKILQYVKKLKEIDFPDYSNFKDINEAYSDFTEKVTSVTEEIAPMRKSELKAIHRTGLMLKLMGFDKTRIPSSRTTLLVGLPRLPRTGLIYSCLIKIMKFWIVE